VSYSAPKDFFYYLDKPRKWPRWLRRLYVLTLPAALLLHGLLIVGIVLGALLLWPTIIFACWMIELWRGNSE